MDTSNTPGSQHELADSWLEPSPLTVEEMDTMRAIEIEIAAIESKFTGLELDKQMQSLVERREDAINAMLAKVGAAKQEQDTVSNTLNTSIENNGEASEAALQTLKDANDAFNEAADEYNAQVLLDAQNAEYTQETTSNLVDATLFDHTHVSNGAVIVADSEADSSTNAHSRVNLAA